MVYRHRLPASVHLRVAVGDRVEQHLPLRIALTGCPLRGATRPACELSPTLEWPASLSSVREDL
jgi:hypothetical protein